MKKSFLIFFEWREREIQKYVVLVFRRLYLTFGINILYIWHNIDMTCLERLFSEIHINDFIYDFKIRSFVMFRKFLIYSDCNISQKLYVCTSVCVCVCAYTYVPIRVCPCVCVRTCVFLYETILVCSYTSTASTSPLPNIPSTPQKKSSHRPEMRTLNAFGQWSRWRRVCMEGHYHPLPGGQTFLIVGLHPSLLPPCLSRSGIAAVKMSYPCLLCAFLFCYYCC